MKAYVYNATHDRITEAPTRRAAMAAAKRLAGPGARFLRSRCHGIVGSYTGQHGTFTITE
jgi:hypothetical protein